MPLELPRAQRLSGRNLLKYDYSHVLRAFYGVPWAILPSKLAAMRDFLDLKAGGHEIDQADIEAAAGSRRDDGVQMAGRVAVVPVFGTLCQRIATLEQASGGISAERLGVTLDGLVEDKQVRSILLAFDSPGGAVAGVPELADKIRGYRGQKKCVAIADSMAASAAYWLASQAQEVYCTPSGMVGSIGVLAAHEDLSDKLKEEGRKVTLITAGKYKGEGNPYEPLSDAAKEEMQSKVDHYYGAFVDAVAAGRGTTVARVKADYGQGRMLTADQAKRAGMVDRVSTLAQLLDRMGAYGDTAGARAETEAPAINCRRRKLDLEMED
jgi:capsid assembly protease